MKRVVVITMYEAYIPKDMSIESLRENIEAAFENRLDNFGVSSKGYHDENNSFIIFNTRGVSIGTEVTLKVSGD